MQNILKPSEQNRKFNDSEIDSLRAFNQLQYDRIDKLENQRFNFGNLILTITIGVIVFGYKDTMTQINDNIKGIILPLTLVIGNLFAIIFFTKSRRFIKIHQDRAEEARACYAPILNEINSCFEKPDSDKDWLRRDKLYKYLHYIIIFIFSLIFLKYVILTFTSLLE